MLTLALSLILGIPLVYWCIHLYRFLTTVTSEQASTPPPVSIIVCAHDEEQNLRELIPLLLAQDHPEVEIVLVNDRSNDGTYDLLLGLDARHPNLKILTVRSKPEHIPGKKFALTLGIKAASHEIVLLTDADCRPGPAWSRTMAACFTPSTDIVLGVSPYAEKEGPLQGFIRYEADLTAVQYTAMARAGMPYMGVGRNLAYRKRLFFEGKGFNKHIHVTGGDDDLFVNEHARADNTRTCLIPAAVVPSKPVTTWSAFFHQKLRHLSVGKFYRTLHQAILAPWSLSTMFQVPAMVLAATASTAPVALVLLGALVMRWIVMAFTFHLFSKESGVHRNLLAIPVLDIAYAAYYLALAPVALLTRRIQWKN